MLILGSESPRRKEILGFFKLPFLQVPSYFDESKVVWNKDPAHYVQKLSEEKSLCLTKSYPKNVIITADTVVYRRGKLFEKPKDLDEARFLLKTLSGKWHTVYTGVTVRKGTRVSTGVAKSRVLMNSLGEDHIERYLETALWKDKAAGYAIQGQGALLIEKIDGCFYNVMGLPIGLLASLLASHGIDLWHHLN